MDSGNKFSIDFPADLPTLRELSPRAVEELAHHMTPLELKAGETLFTPGKPYRNIVYLLDTGRMELRYPGKPASLLEPGSFIGIENYFDASPYKATATAIDNAKLYAITATSLREAEHRHPEIFNTINRWLTERIRSQAGHPVTGVWALPARAIMKSPLVTCSPQATVKDALTIMNQRRIGSLGVVDGSRGLLGIVTFVTLAEGAIIRHSNSKDSVLTVCEEPRLIDYDAPLWKVQSEQARSGTRYLVVRQDDRPIGIISQTDVLYTLISDQRSILAQVNDLENFEALQNFQNRLGQIAAELRQNNRSAGMAVRALSEIHLAVQRRCIELVLREMQEKGLGTPPAPFAFLIMGSGGRKEMMIRTDQDNGIILADAPATARSETRNWFMDFCDRINHRLDEIGYAWCTGNIMARNPDFHKSLIEWKRHLSRIAEIPTEKSARWSTIFFDFETLYGDDGLTRALRTHLFEQLRVKPRLLKLMVEDDATGGPAIGWFNRLVTASDKARKGKIDLKRNGTRILADAARIYALSESIDATNTGDRYSALVRQGRLDTAFVESVLAAYDELLDLTLGHQLRQGQRGEPIDKLLDISELTPLEEESLRMAMRVIKHLQGRLQGEFGTIML